MRVVVCVSRVVESEQALVPVGTRAHARTGELTYALNPADLNALEQALRIRDALPGTEVVTLTLGPPDSESVLRDTLALGADRALRIWDEACEGGDTLATARTLAAAIRCIEADIVVCGQRASDGNTGQVGLQIAAMLGAPGLSGVLQLEVETGTAHVVQRLDGARRSRVACPLPAVMVIDAGSNQPRYPRMSDRLRSNRETIRVFSLEDAGIRAADVGKSASRVTVLSVTGPKPTRRGIFVPDEALSPEQRLEQLISGGVSASPSSRASAEPSMEQQISDVLSFLVEGKYC